MTGITLKWKHGTVSALSLGVMEMDEARALRAPKRDNEGRIFEFEYGDRTISTLRGKPLVVLNDRTRDGEAHGAVSEAAGEDTIARIERNLDLALGGIQALLRRIDSIDETLAKLINR